MLKGRERRKERVNEGRSSREEALVKLASRQLWRLLPQPPVESRLVSSQCGSSCGSEKVGVLYRCTITVTCELRSERSQAEYGHQHGKAPVAYI
jgi:hypothetical protein